MVSRKHLKLFPVREKISLPREKKKKTSHFQARMWNYGWGNWQQGNSHRSHVSWGIWGNIRADDSNRGGPDLLDNVELRGNWGDRIHFGIFYPVFHPVSAVLAAGLHLTHKGSMPSACQRSSSWRGTRLSPPCSGEATVAATGEWYCAQRECCRTNLCTNNNWFSTHMHTHLCMLSLKLWLHNFTPFVFFSKWSD